jgi:hypothetical protein
MNIVKQNCLSLHTRYLLRLFLFNKTIFKPLTLATKNRIASNKLLNGFPQKNLKPPFTIAK